MLNISDHDLVKKTHAFKDRAKLRLFLAKKWSKVLLREREGKFSGKGFGSVFCSSLLGAWFFLMFIKGFSHYSKVKLCFLNGHRGPSLSCWYLYIKDSFELNVKVRIVRILKWNSFLIEFRSKEKVCILKMKFIFHFER